MSSPFIIRCRSSKGTKRLVFTSDGANWRDLQLQIKDVLGVKICNQILSREATGGIPGRGPRTKMEGTDLKATLKSLGFRRGDMVHLESKQESKESKQPLKEMKPIFRLTNRCQHGPNARCGNCTSKTNLKGEQIFEENQLCDHGPHTTCIHCSSHVQDTDAGVATWLCDHPETSFCPKCLPPDMMDVDEKGSPQGLSCSCDKSRGQTCTRCINSDGPVIKVDMIPFARYLADRNAMCKYKHGANASCAFCAAPSLPVYKGTRNCRTGHRPWPQGSCLSCAPELAHIIHQPYRHCDSVSLPAKLAQRVYGTFARNGGANHHAALLFGKFIDEPGSTKNMGAIRANVHAIYEPPQHNKPDGMRFLRDPEEKNVHCVAAELGLEPVGWIVVRQPSDTDEKYGGKVVLTGSEIVQAARFQEQYKNDAGYSRMVTIVLEHGVTVEPKAYMVSDQCTALVRDGVVEKCLDDVNLLRTHKPRSGEMAVPVSYQNKDLPAGSAFLPDDFIVKVIVSTGSTSGGLFSNFEVDFPAQGANDTALTSHLEINALREYHDKLADFNLLCYLTKAIGVPLTRQICQAIRNKVAFDRELSAALDRALMPYMR